MSRKMYFQILAVLIGSIIVAIIGLAAWVIGLIPALVYPKMFSFFSTDSVTYHVSKKILRSSMRRSTPQHEKVI